MDWPFFIAAIAFIIIFSLIFIISVLIVKGNPIKKKKGEREIDLELFDKKKQEEKGKHIEEEKKKEEERKRKQTFTFKCIVRTCNNKEFYKSNGSIYILQNVEIIDGALNGCKVVAERTILSAYTGNENDPIPVGEEAIVYLTLVPRLDDPTKLKPLFQLAQSSTASDDDINVEQRQKLEKYKINYLYHMTHKDNLENILRYGLKSHNEAKKENLNKVDISDNQVNDRRSRKEPIFKRSIHDYVPLYFNPKNPMLYVRKQLQNDIVILAMNPMLLYNDDALFTDGNAASNPTKFYRNIDDLEKLDWSCINSSSWYTYQDGKRLRCSEVLVYSIIKTNQILKIFCNNSTTEEFAKQKIGNFVNGKIPVEIKYDLYF